jgi:hypothetical protein
MSSIENTEHIELIEETLSLEAPKRTRGRPKLTIDTTLPDEAEESPPKVKRVQSEKQKQNFIRALEVRKQKIEERKAAKLALEEAKEVEQEVKKKERERKIIKKAVVLKKRSILEETALDEISDDDIPDSVIQKVIKKQKAKAKATVPKPVAPAESPKQKYNFV